MKPMDMMMFGTLHAKCGEFGFDEGFTAKCQKR